MGTIQCLYYLCFLFTVSNAILNFFFNVHELKKKIKNLTCYRFKVKMHFFL